VTARCGTSRRSGQTSGQKPGRKRIILSLINHGIEEILVKSFVMQVYYPEPNFVQKINIVESEP
jgi:hypothetical protein